MIEVPPNKKSYLLTQGKKKRDIFTDSPLMDQAGKSYRRESLRTVDLLVLSNIDQILFTMNILFTFLQTSYLNEEVICRDPFPEASIPWIKRNMSL
jgi:hypothetical protein